MRKGRTKEVVEYVERLIDIEPHQVEWRLLQALCYEMMGQLTKAKRMFKEILRWNPLLLRALHSCIMAPSNTYLKDLTEKTRQFTVKVKIIEKSRPQLSASKVMYQRIRMQDEKGKCSATVSVSSTLVHQSHGLEGSQMQSILLSSRDKSEEYVKILMFMWQKKDQDQDLSPEI